MSHRDARLTPHGRRLLCDVTNVYRLEDGQWKMIHHHTDVSTGLVEIMQRQQAA
jgi:hypothetical protein